MKRRGFLKGLAGAGVTAALGGRTAVANRLGTDAQPPAPAADPVSVRDEAAPARRFRVGVESVLPGEGWWATIYGRFLGATYDADMWRRALHELGAEFTLFYDSLSPAKPDACRRISDLCAHTGVDFLFNNTYGDIYGPWVPGTGRAEYPDEALVCAAATGRFRGVILDEVEHRQIHHADCGPGAYLADVTGLTLPQCYERLLSAVQGVADRYRGFGAATVAEMVFPVLGHVFARAGIVPAPKFLSESYSPVHFAICAGAAKQYGTECWVVHDFWGMETFWGALAPFAPAFGPEAFRSSLLLAYWLGADAAYTEGLHNLIGLSKLTEAEREAMAAHRIGHRAVQENEWVFERRYYLNAYGKIHRWFATHYLPGHPRPYTFRDIRPRVAIVRFPDSLWGRPDDSGCIAFHKGLYGPGGPRAGSQHTAWLDAWRLLTHGTTPSGGVSMFCHPHGVHRNAAIEARVREIGPDAPLPDYPYEEVYPFCPVDGVLVFDHLARAQDLAGVELIILTGECVSPETRQAILERVEAGAHCLALEHLAPEPVRKGRKTPLETSLGRGRMLVTNDFTSDGAARFVRRHLGPRDRIRYRFGDYTLSIRPGEGYAPSLVNEADFPTA